MGDFQNMRRDLAEVRKRQRSSEWKSIALEFASWVAALAALFLVLRYLT